MRADITEGAKLADYELPDHTDRPRKLSVLQGDDPMILTLIAASTARRIGYSSWS